jgi:hypothetical protein
MALPEEKQLNEKLEQNRREEPMSLIMKVIVIGFIGGVLWSSLAYLTYIFNFTVLSPNLVLQPWAVGSWKDSVLGNFIGIFVIGLLSILVAFLYYGLLKRIQSIWAGIIFGLALFGLVFYVLNPLFPGLQSVTELDRNTVITTICFYILYGVFIGYSISFEANEMQNYKEAAAANK